MGANYGSREHDRGSSACVWGFGYLMGWVRFRGPHWAPFPGSRCSRVFSLSQAMRPTFGAIGMPACRMCIIPMCIIPVSLTIAPTRGRQQLPLRRSVWRSNWRRYIAPIIVAAPEPGAVVTSTKAVRTVRLTRQT